MFQNTEKHSIFVDAFLKTSETSPVFCCLTNFLLLPSKNSDCTQNQSCYTLPLHEPLSS